MYSLPNSPFRITTWLVVVSVGPWAPCPSFSFSILFSLSDGSNPDVAASDYSRFIVVSRPPLTHSNPHGPSSTPLLYHTSLIRGSPPPPKALATTCRSWGGQTS